MLISIGCESINNSVSLFHAQFVLDLFFFFKQFQSHCIYEVYSYTKIKVYYSCRLQRRKTRGRNHQLKYYDFWFLGKKYICCNLLLGPFSWGTVFLSAICPRANYVGNKSSKRPFSSRAISRGILSGDSYLWGKCPGAIIQGAIAQEASFLRGNCLDTYWNLILTLKNISPEKKKKKEETLSEFSYFFRIKAMVLNFLVHSVF